MKAYFGASGDNLEDYSSLYLSDLAITFLYTLMC